MRKRVASETAPRESEAGALRFLAEASALLSVSLDYEATLQQVARLVVPRLADWCTVDLVDDDGLIQRVAAAHAAPEKEPLIHETLRRYPMKIEDPRGVAIVLRTGRSNLQTELTDEDLRKAAKNAEHLEFLRSLMPRSHLIAPLIARGRRLGALSCVFGESGRRYTVADVSLVEDLASRAATAIDNARLYREARNAEQEVRELNLTLERRVAERTSELEAANKELESFSYSVSHDLREPLRAIDGFCHLLEENHGPRLDADGQRCIQRVRRNAQRMGQLIDDLLQFARMGRLALQPVPLPMEELIRSVFEEVHAEAAGRRIEFKLERVPPAHGDPAMIRQAVDNLISNAVKYTSTRETAIIEAGGHATEDGKVYFVRDNGVGFDMRYAHKLFGVFERLHSSDEFQGTGVGLAIVQRIVHRHGGRVWADAKVNGGATFYFSLPAE